MLPKVLPRLLPESYILIVFVGGGVPRGTGHFREGAPEENPIAIIPRSKRCGGAAQSGQLLVLSAATPAVRLAIPALVLVAASSVASTTVLRYSQLTHRSPLLPLLAPAPTAPQFAAWEGETHASPLAKAQCWDRQSLLFGWFQGKDRQSPEVGRYILPAVLASNAQLEARLDPAKPPPWVKCCTVRRR